MEGKDLLKPRAIFSTALCEHHKVHLWVRMMMNTKEKLHKADTSNSI